MKIMPNRLDRSYFKYQEEFEKAVLRVLRSGWYVLGTEVENFEKRFAQYIGTKYCVGLASGLDALWLAFKILGIGEGDEVLVQGNTYIASVMGITINGALPIFVEPNEFFNIDSQKLEEKITSKTKAILVTHLYGQATDMENIKKICNKYQLKLVEDCAQSHGAKYAGQLTGSFGDVGCFSFYPSKNLGGFGDGGAICTNNFQIAEAFKIYRNYGSEKRYYNKVVGANSRLDEIQAALLNVKLDHLDELNKERQKIAERYNEKLNNRYINKPLLNANCSSVFHQYVITCQDRQHLQDFLEEKGIGTIIHYPIPPFLSEAYSYLGYKKGDFPITERLADTVLSIPMYNGMTKEEQDYVIENMNLF